MFARQGARHGELRVDVRHGDVKMFSGVATWNVVLVAGIEFVLLFGVMLTGLIALYSDLTCTAAR